MDRTSTRVLGGLGIALAILIAASASIYAVIDYKYPNDFEWIHAHLFDSRIADTFRVEDARKDGYSDREIASYLANTFTERRERYMRLLIIGATALALIMILLAWGVIVLRREPSCTGRPPLRFHRLSKSIAFVRGLNFVSAHSREGGDMKKATKLRLIGGCVLLFNIWLVGHYNFHGIPVLLLTLGFAVGYEYLVVRPATKQIERVD